MYYSVLLVGTTGTLHEYVYIIYPLMIGTLIDLGLNENQAKVWLAVWQYRMSPASKIGSLTGMERTHAYKILLQLQERGLIDSSLRGKTSYFYVPDKSVLRSLIDKQYIELQTNESNLGKLEGELDSLIHPEQALLPPIRQRTGQDGVAAGFNDCINTCLESNIRKICFFGTKTLESIATSVETFAQKRQQFMYHLDQHRIIIEGFEGTGMYLLEHIVSDIHTDEIATLPTGDYAIQVVIVGSNLYFILYRREPVMIKITSSEIAQMMRVLLRK